MKKALPILLLAASACDRLDYQGMDPRMYEKSVYSKNISVETENRIETFEFEKKSARFDNENLMAFKAFLGDIHPASADFVNVRLGKANQERELYVVRLLRQMGYQKRKINVSVDKTLLPENVEVDIQNTKSVLPKCPDWRKSAKYNYSNTVHSNHGCSNIVNFGRMVANPRDIERTDSTHIMPEPLLDALAIGSYKYGVVNSETSSSGSEATTATPSGETSGNGSTGQ